METAEPKVSLTISVPLSTYVTVKTLSKMQRRSMNELLSGVVERYLEMDGVQKYRLMSAADIAKLREEIRAEMEKEKQLLLEL